MTDYLPPGCKKCGLYEHVKTYKVPLERSPGAGRKVDVLFFGRDPGWNEDQEGRPLSPNGDSGAYLRGFLDAVDGWTWALDNVVRCHTPNNCGPSKKQLDACAGFTQQVIEECEPTVIVALGADALKQLYPSAGGVGKARSSPIKMADGRWLLATYHPSPHNIKNLGLEAMDEEYIRVFNLIDRILEGDTGEETLDIRSAEPGDLNTIIKQAHAGKYRSLDIETNTYRTIPERQVFWQDGARLHCLNFGTHPSEPKWVIPGRFVTREFLQELLYRGHLVGANVKGDINALEWWYDVDLWRLLEQQDDVMLWNGARNQSLFNNALKPMTTHYAGAPNWAIPIYDWLKKETERRMALNKERKKQGLPPLPMPTYEDVPWHMMVQYGGRDAHYPMVLLELFQSQFELPPIYPHLMRWMPMLANVERVGILIEREIMALVERMSRERVRKIEDWIRDTPEGKRIQMAYKRSLEAQRKREAENRARTRDGMALLPKLYTGGHPMHHAEPVIDSGAFVNSDKFLHRLLDETGLEVLELTDTGQPSISKSTLPELAQHSPVWKAVEASREIRSRLSKFIVKFQLFTLTKDRRIHTDFKQIRTEDTGIGMVEEEGGTETGRLASRDPNIQNLSWDPIFSMAIRPRPGYVLALFDYSQMEPRIVAWRAKCKRLIEIILGGGDDIYEGAARIIPSFGLGPNDPVPKPMRDKLKRGVLAKIYRQSIAACAKMLGIPYEEAEAFFHEFDRIFPELEAFSSAEIANARAGNPQITAHGRIRTYDFNVENPWHVENEVGNNAVQADASDVMNTQAYHVWEKYSPLWFQAAPAPMYIVNFVHDALWTEIRQDVFEEVCRDVKAIMENTSTLLIPYDLPLAVDIKAGPEAARLEKIKL